jgi:hypothetical protein
LIIGRQFCTGILEDGHEGEKLKNCTINIRYQGTAIEDAVGWGRLKDCDF